MQVSCTWKGSACQAVIFDVLERGGLCFLCLQWFYLENTFFGCFRQVLPRTERRLLPVCNVHMRPSYLHGVWRLSLDKRKRVGGDLWLKARVPDLCGLASAKRRRPQKNIFHKLSTRSQVFSDSPRTAFAREVTASSVAQQVLQLYAAASMWRVADELPSEHPPILGYTWQRL